MQRWHSTKKLLRRLQDRFNNWQLMFLNADRQITWSASQNYCNVTVTSPQICASFEKMPYFQNSFISQNVQSATGQEAGYIWDSSPAEQRDKRPNMLTLTPWVHLEPLCFRCWTLGWSWSTWTESKHAQGEHADTVSWFKPEIFLLWGKKC